MINHLRRLRPLVSLTAAIRCSWRRRTDLHRCRHRRRNGYELPMLPERAPATASTHPGPRRPSTVPCRGPIPGCCTT